MIPVFHVAVIAILALAAPPGGTASNVFACSDDADSGMDAGNWWGQADRLVFHSICTENYGPHGEGSPDPVDWFFLDTVPQGNSAAFVKACGPAGFLAHMVLYVVPGGVLLPELGGSSLTSAGEEALQPFQKDQDVADGCSGELHGGITPGPPIGGSRIYIQMRFLGVGDGSYKLEVHPG